MTSSFFLDEQLGDLDVSADCAGSSADLLFHHSRNRRSSLIILRRRRHLLSSTICSFARIAFFCTGDSNEDLFKSSLCFVSAAGPAET